ncbi:putative protein YuaQ [Escherichia coli K-12] [Rhizoctonia solani]|uniref:Peptidase A1 domain-containing protein n=1 Tax=Rhizoctonia solani TaxID=456999 RepID=A0A0K6GB82_9AGAM|nr:putative protein YuaQ [Escherichia coli K-12] [Rhizoctonia solani]
MYTTQPIDSKEDIELKDVGMPHPDCSDHSHTTRSYVPDHKSSAIHFAHEHASRESTTRGRINRIIRNIWLTGFMPVVAFAYISFCYSAATRVVPVRIWMVDEPTSHLSAIKAGITTINIIIITLSLLPLKSLLDELKGEEFFRMLRISKSGVPMKAINNVSTPSHTYVRGLLSIIQTHASKYYAGAVLTGLMATLISSLAPAALSVGVISVDKELTAFRVGAVASDSVIKQVEPLFAIQRVTYDNSEATEAASMGWVQQVLGINLTFQATSLKYGVPVPLDLQAFDRARYVTDVAVMNPVCTWTVPSPPVVPVANASDSSAVVNLTLPDFGVSTQLYPRNFGFPLLGSKMSLTVLGEDITSALVNISTGDPPITGVMGWLMTRCKSCQPSTEEKFYNTINMTGLPTQEYQGVRIVGNVSEPETAEFSILMCDPRLSVETREVRLDGSGRITVMENGGLTRQGNLHLAQTRLLLGKGLAKFGSDSGPNTMFSGVGQETQIKMFFGPIENSTLTPVLTPRPISELTHGYMVAQQAAMRSYLSGRMSSSVVPGRMQEMKLVFTSSLPQVVVSTVLFVFAAIFINACYLRSDTEQFTLFSVAAALSNSNLGRMCEDVKYVDRGRGTPPQNTSFAINIGSSVQFALTPDCLFCPTEGMYDTSSSSSLVKDPGLGVFGDSTFGGTRGYEAITLGGLLQDNQSLMGHLGLFVPQSNETRRKQSVIYRLNERDQLLNPVWGLRLGGENPQLTIGALDPNDYEGEINWVPLVNDSSRIQIDALKGYNGNAFPLPSPITAWIDTLSKNIYMPDLSMYYMNDSLIGPNQFINLYPSDSTRFAVRCNGTEPPSVEFSIEINGVDYPMNQTDLIRPTGPMAAPGYCNLGVMKSSAADYTLGVTFLRSVYLAYRFPTGSCPGYYGFAVPKGGPTPTSKQKPRTTPTDAATCLSFVTPSSTPTPTIAVSKELQPSGSSEETYPVHGRTEDQWVALRGVKDLPPLKVSGGIYGFGG